MTEILALLQNIAPVVSATILQQMSHMIYGMLISNGRITMLEISRLTDTGGSYRTIQRLYIRHCYGCKSGGYFLQASYRGQGMNTLPQVMKWYLAKPGKRHMGLGVSFPFCKTCHSWFIVLHFFCD